MKKWINKRFVRFFSLVNNLAMALTKGQEHLGSRIFKFATLGVTEELICNLE